MSIPSNGYFVSGQGVVSADALNTFVQTTSTYATLRSIGSPPGPAVMIVQGSSSAGGGGGGIFWYNSASTATDNGTTVIVPSGNVQGAWLALVNFT